MNSKIPFRALSEDDFDLIIARAGGQRLVIQDPGDLPENADYTIGNTILELKFIDEEGLEKEERQSRIAEIFTNHQPARPVIVLDHEALQHSEKTRFLRAIEGPIKAAVTKANRQFKITKKHNLNLDNSILVIVNNGYYSLNHELFTQIVTHRVRNDTNNIDKIIVAGVYIYTDGIETIILPKFDMITINKDTLNFTYFDKIYDEWNKCVQKMITERLQMPAYAISTDTKSLEVNDVTFDVNGIRFVRPAPPFGGQSSIYPRGRPRLNSSVSADKCPKVGITAPALSPQQWNWLKTNCPSDKELHATFNTWQKHHQFTDAKSSELKPFVAVPFSEQQFTLWLKNANLPMSYESVRNFANDVFEKTVRKNAIAATETTNQIIEKNPSSFPDRFMYAITEIIGQDANNDVSHIFALKRKNDDSFEIFEIAINLRITLKHAKILAAAYGVHENIDAVYFGKNNANAWF